MTYDLQDRAQELFKDDKLQQKWVQAIEWLRTKSKTGWLLDSSGASLAK